MARAAGVGWRRWHRQRRRRAARLAQLGARAGLPSGRDRASADPRGTGAGDRRGRRGGAPDQGRRLRVTRSARRRSPTAPCCGSRRSTGCSTSTAPRAWSRSRPARVLGELNRAPRRSRARLREPRRHRQADAGRLDLDRDPRHRDPLPERLRPARGDRADRRRRRHPRAQRRIRRRRPSRAARVGLGALGAIYSVTMRTVPAYTLNRLDHPLPLGEVLDSLDDRVDAVDHFEFYVFPHTETALCRESTRTDEPPEPPNPAGRYVREVVLENWLSGAFSSIWRVPCPRWGRVSRAWRRRSFANVSKVDQSYRVFASERRLKFTEMEYGIPREHAREAVERVLEVASRPEMQLRVPGRGPLRQGRRRAAQPQLRARHLLHRRPPGPQARLARLLPRGRDDPRRLRRSPALGQAPRADPRRARAALPALGRLPGGPQAPRPRGPLRQRVHRPRARSDRPERPPRSTLRGRRGPRRGRSGPRRRSPRP